MVIERLVLGGAPQGDVATMHICVHDPCVGRVNNLSSELEMGGFSVVPIEADFFCTDTRTLRARTSDRAAFLIADCQQVLDYIRLLRAADCDSPILVMRETRNATAAAAALDAGADDDLVLPIKPVELRSRINRIARRASGHATESITLGEARIFFDGRHPVICGQTVPLSRREYAIFHELALGAGRCVSKRALYDSVYGMSEDQPFDKVIDVYICKLRKKFANASSVSHPYIETVHGRGYKLTEPTSSNIEAAE